MLVYQRVVHKGCNIYGQVSVAESQRKEWSNLKFNPFSEGIFDTFVFNRHMACACCVADEPPETVTVFSEVKEEPKEAYLAPRTEEAPRPPAEEPKPVMEDAVDVVKPKEEPEVPPGQYTLKIKKEGRLYCSMETLIAEFCMVRRVDAESPLENVKPMDRLVSINGKREDAASMVKMLAESSGMLELVFERPVIKEITLMKSGTKAGFRVDPALDTCGLMIKGVQDGAAAEMPAGTFNPTDRIMAVDGVEDRPAGLLKLIGGADAPVLKVCTYAQLPLR
eukprot:s756_g7.t1